MNTEPKNGHEVSEPSSVHFQVEQVLRHRRNVQNFDHVTQNTSVALTSLGLANADIAVSFSHTTTFVEITA